MLHLERMNSTKIDEPLIDPFARDAGRVNVEHGLSSVCELMVRWCENDPPQGYILGKTALRDHLIVELDLSAADAETIIDRFESAGVLVYEGEEAGVDEQIAAWRVERGAITRVS